MICLVVYERCKKRGERLRSLTRSLRTTALDGEPVTLVLETLGSNQTLDAGGLGVVFLALAGDGAADDELADVILLVQTEETADLGGTLGTETLGDNGVGQTGQLLLTLLDDAEGQDGKVEVGDGTTDGLALALTSAAGAVAAINTTSDQFPVRSLFSSFRVGEGVAIYLWPSLRRRRVRVGRRTVGEIDKFSCSKVTWNHIRSLHTTLLHGET